MRENSLFGELVVSMFVCVPTAQASRPTVEKFVTVGRIPCEFGESGRKLNEFREANPELRAATIAAKWITSVHL